MNNSLNRIAACMNCGEPREITAFRPPRSNADGNRSITGEPINAELKQHAVEVDDWRYREQVRVLHEWAERFNEEFDLALQTPAIRLTQFRSAPWAAITLAEMGLAFDTK